MQNLNYELLLSDLNSQRVCQIFGRYLRNVIIDYKVHRLLLQPSSSSYLLNEDLEPAPDIPALKTLFQCWNVAAAGQNSSMLQTVLIVGRANCRERQRKVLSAPKVLTQLRFWGPAAVAVMEVAYR